MDEEELKIVKEINCCLKRISDFLSAEGYKEIRKYTDRLEFCIEKIECNNKMSCILTDELTDYIKKKTIGRSTTYPNGWIKIEDLEEFIQEKKREV